MRPAYRGAYVTKDSGEKVIIAIGYDENQSGDYKPIEGAKWMDFIFDEIPELDNDLKSLVTDNNLPMCLKINADTVELRTKADVLTDKPEDFRSAE